MIKNLKIFATFSQSDEDIPTGADITVEGCAVTTKGELALVGTMEVNENRDILLALVNTEGKMVRYEKGILVVDKVGEDIISKITPFGDLGAQSGSSVKTTLEGGLVITGSNSLEGNSVIALVKTNARGEF